MGPKSYVNEKVAGVSKAVIDRLTRVTNESARLAKEHGGEFAALDDRFTQVVIKLAKKDYFTAEEEETDLNLHLDIVEKEHMRLFEELNLPVGPKRIVLELPQGLTQKELEQARWVLMDALIEYKLHRGHENAEAYVKERYKSMPPEFQSEKVELTELRFKVASTLRNFTDFKQE